MTARHAKLHGVEAARGVAALLVVLVHATNMLAPAKYLGAVPLAGVFKFGHAGVDFFFVLSGFIIYFIHGHELGDRSRWLPYWRKRLIRIYPVYWIVLLGYGAILAVSPTRDMTERMPAVIVSAITLYPHELGPILGVAWTLSHEMLFYGLFGLMFLNRRLGATVLAVWAGLVVVNLLQPFGDHFWRHFVFRIFNIHFFLGMLVAHAVRHWPLRSPAAFLVGGVALFFGAGLRESLGAPVPVEWAPLHLAYGLGSAAAVYGLVGLEQSGRLKVPRLAVALGAASYSVYLLHTIVIMLFQQVLLRITPAVLAWPTFAFVLTVLVAVAASMCFSRVIEQPLLRFLNRRSR